MSRATSATIHLGALRHNLARLRSLAHDAKVMAVVKADGYGHGLERVARALSAADAFGVACIADGQRLRASGVRQRIVVLSGIDEPADIAEMHRLDLESAVHHAAQIDWLAADRDPRPLRVWLKLDSGMHRLGFAPHEARAAYQRLRALSNVDPAIGLMTHFANSDAFGDAQTAQQIDVFAATFAGLAGERALSNSAAVLGWERARGDWVRPGGLLYGISVIEGRSAADLGFRPAMTFASKLVAINRVARGEPVGYAATWHCPEDMDVGVIQVGYGDGYPRSAATGTPVLVGEARVPIIGRVSMDLVTVDLRAAPQARIGERVVLWGEGLPVEEIAAHAGTIGYELTCGMTRRVRFLEDEG
ncbi:MAG TPA: alanine racemase [Dokdonella sp.]|uniref:alanine racemase n=1 Tax=Dokdonella sp. TaxID=2291710 RepID=UPI0025B8CBD4|nr:alanine racemase [Dokdonella sp.]MBX3693409.1 alanine racemase [Dokdonella sp.]MCW5567164.1 alanine racemase [Dokdonella sp.]HNR91556.1 alanine racemase [Dokdonella sp.]